MEFDKYADNYDAGFMGKGSGRFYADLIKEIEVKDGDSVPVKGDIPIFIDEREMRETLHILEDTKGVKTCYPAWDQTYTAEMMEHKLNEAGELIDLLKKAVSENEAGELIDLLKKAVSESDDGGELPVLVDRVCNRLKTPMLKSNPLFSRTIECLRKEA